MAPDQDLPIETEQADAPAPAETARPGRRPGRGHRGRGRRRRAKAPRADSVSVEPLEAGPAERELAAPRVVVCQPPSAAPEAGPETAVREETVTPPRRGQPLSQVSIQGAIEQVNEIVRSLKDALEQMDEVLESLEYFERQGNADEREIESLRRSLRQLQRPRDGGHHSHRSS